MRTEVKENYKGILLCILIAIPAWILGKKFNVIGAPIIAILFGIILSCFIKNKKDYIKGVKFSSKKILQYAVILLGFGLDLNIVLKTGKESLPIILSTISISLLAAYLIQKILKLPSNIAILIGVGSSICGGSAIAATAPIIDANDDELASSISVIFLFNVLAAILFPLLGKYIGFNTLSGDSFGIFAGTAVNDTSSVTAAASTWDLMYNLGTATLDKAVTVKLTRTLAIIPISLILAFISNKKINKNKKLNLKQIFPFFIIYFVLASIFTTICTHYGFNLEIFHYMKILSKFFIVIAMAGIGFSTDIKKLIKTGSKSIILGFVCSISIIITSIALQIFLGLF